MFSFHTQFVIIQVNMLASIFI